MSAAGRRKAQVVVDRAARDRDDFYVTPPEAVWSLLDVEKFDGGIWEPACGDGAIADRLEGAGHWVVASDLVYRGYGRGRVDFLLERELLAPNIVTNPPFKLAVEFVEAAERLRASKLALLLRLAFLEGAERLALFRRWPPVRVWVFSRRLTMWRRGEVTSAAGGTVAFAWFVWERDFNGAPTLGWIDPGLGR